MNELLDVNFGNRAGVVNNAMDGLVSGVSFSLRFSRYRPTMQNRRNNRKRADHQLH
ncbi:hypothetical protein [Lentilactobacillus parabuchneri]|uniref:hypothetical protein n=1 Tax=Lentilactobacillus parabuchneri TaxID=152331 RepID=UPI0015C46B0A|nr:hypothetical protein [Lentilactobacillus parabuchneri]MCW4399682.1 hypothetical protein [Lentilactobacillus parabuchneri]MDB1104381.1 hypothetical protein [Lentilactobacillus parabuchneri]MDN6434884.1 hypothetical protein [Lentilactobacillus parabuchneri]MDN6780486.1 hypothetical protein [Lentilactobacillus parabuchneri]MDN6786479.1 hypothetical protein [Lentilactobacillus parabuchneri]